MKIAVVTDSIADLDQAYAQRSGVKIVPSHILFDLTRHLDDGKTIQVPQMLHDMVNGKGTVSTTPPTVEQYHDAYREMLGTADHIISLHTSPLIAQNIVNAQQAAQDYQSLVTILDCRATSASQGLQVKRLVDGIEQGKSLEQLIAEQRRSAQSGLLSFVVDELRFLRMNGRISAAAALIGGALNLKPILSTREGKLEATGRALGHRRAMNTLAETVRQYQRNHGDIRLAFAYAPGGEVFAQELRRMLTSMPFEDMGDWPLGAAIAANAGPGVVGIALEPA